MSNLHDPYAARDSIQSGLVFLALVTLLLGYNFFITRVRKFWRLKAFNPLIVIAIAYFGMICSISIPTPFKTKEAYVKAQQFKWPKGCDQKYYAWLQPIPRECGIEKNEILNYRDYGLFTVSRSKERGYFRVGDDALLTECRSDPFGLKTCEVGERYRNFYHR